MKETLNTLRRYAMKLNPKKSAFRVSAGKFPRLMIKKRETEENLEMVKAMLDIVKT